jgi:hypothetical protein
MDHGDIALADFSCFGSYMHNEEFTYIFLNFDKPTIKIRTNKLGNML